ncbi:MAG: MFS transporter [Bryobacterales bacterium]|nr:MFS transporter [Bryobacteraceae bacterium]MDW8355427.1 MFS transporter [Bryobacterales bacterium]
MDQRPVSFTAYWRLVQSNRNFRLLWLAQIVSELGDWLYSIAIYSLLLELTGSAKSVATAVVLQVLPQFFIAPAAGVLNDRMSRKRVMILADVARAAIVLGMLAVQRADLVWCIYLLLFAETTMWAFFEPARNAVIPNICRGPDVLIANALSSTTWSFNLAVGSAIGGAVAVVFGRQAVFVINAATFLLSALLLRAMCFSEPHVTGSRPLRWGDLTDFSPLFEGFRYVRSDARLVATLLVKAGLGLMGTNWVILPVLGERVFPVELGRLDPQRAGMLGMSLLMGARGIGALIGPILGSYWAGQQEPRLRKGILLGFLAGAAGYLALGAAPSLPAAAAAIIVAHAGGSLIWVFSTTLLQIHTDDRFRGRVFSADYAFFVVTMSSVTYLGGLLVDLGMSPQKLAALTGSSGLIPALAWTLALRLWERPAPSTPSCAERAQPLDGPPRGL